MNNHKIAAEFGTLATPQICDACVHLDLPVRVAPAGIRPLNLDSHIAGRALPAQHYGSVEIFLEAFLEAKWGDVLVIDDGGSTDAAPVGDLIAAEAHGHGLAGMVIWGTHRDTKQILEIGFPTFSYGAVPVGPSLKRRPKEPLASAKFGKQQVSHDDIVFADADGVVFVAMEHVEAVLDQAREIREAEEAHVTLVREGRTLLEQFRFAAYVEQRLNEPKYTFREHLRSVGGTIEE